MSNFDAILADKIADYEALIEEQSGRNIDLWLVLYALYSLQKFRANQVP